MPDVTITTIPEADDIVIDDVSMNDVAAFQSECLTDGVVTCDWDTLHTRLINHDVYKFWWFLTETERRSIAEMAIKNTLFYLLGYGRDGKTDCGGGEGDWKTIVCISNAIIRYLKFGSPSPFIDSVSRCYWKRRRDDDVEHCYATNTPYNLPCYIVGVYGEEFGHTLCAIHIKQGFESLDNFMVFQYSTVDVKPGDRQMPTGMHVRIDIPISVGCTGFENSGPIAEFEI